MSDDCFSEVSLFLTFPPWPPIYFNCGGPGKWEKCTSDKEKMIDRLSIITFLWKQKTDRSLRICIDLTLRKFLFLFFLCDIRVRSGQIQGLDQSLR